MNIELDLNPKTTCFRMTLARPIFFSGRALFSGEKVNVHIKPSDKKGIFFIRSDHPSPLPIPATIAFALPGYRTTTLARGDQKVQTVEHLLSALFALGITDAIIEMDGMEVPIFDGSALFFAQSIEKAGMVKIEERSDRPKLTAPMTYCYEESYLLALPAEKLSFSYLLDYGDHPLLEKMLVHWDGEPSFYLEHIAKSRTFCLYEEALFMQNSGAVKGFSEECALIFGKESIAVGAPLRSLQEPAYHKLLDLIGDLSLITAPICHIIGIKSGHKTHIEFAKRLGGYSE